MMMCGCVCTSNDVDDQSKRNGTEMEGMTIFGRLTKHAASQAQQWIGPNNFSVRVVDRSK